MSVSLHCDPMGRWVWRDAEGTVHSPVSVVRAYPVTAPEQGVAVVTAEGHELAWFDRLELVPEGLQQSLRQALAEREFLPEILRLVSVSSMVTPSTWTVETDRGLTRLLLKGGEDIRRLTGKVLLVNDAEGVQYLIRDLSAMDRTSRKLLDRFL